MYFLELNVFEENFVEIKKLKWRKIWKTNKIPIREKIYKFRKIRKNDRKFHTHTHKQTKKKKMGEIWKLRTKIVKLPEWWKI